MYCATGWLNQRYKKQRKMIFQRLEIFEFWVCVCYNEDCLSIGLIGTSLEYLTFVVEQVEHLSRPRG